MRHGRVYGLVLWLGSVVVASAPLQARETLGDERQGSEPLPSAVVHPGEFEAEEVDEFAEPRVSMEFKDASLKEVLKAFSKQSGVNVIASEEVGDRTITIYLEDVTVPDALERIVEAADLRYERPPGSEIYVVKPKPPVTLREEPRAPVTMTKVYRLKFARVSKSRLARAVEALGSQTPFEAQQLSSLTATTGTSGGATGGGVGGARLGETGQVGIDRIIEDLLSGEGRVEVDERTNSLIVTEVAENFPRIEAVLTALDIKTPQILVEAEVLETSLAKVKDLGVEWSGSTDEGDVVSLAPSSRKTRFPFNWVGHLDNPSNPTAFGLSTLDFSTFKGVLQALERDTDTKILARPKILTLDNESAVIRLTSQQAIGFRTTTGEQTTTTTTTPERFTTGVILVVTPQVNDGGFITLLVEPSVTKVVSSKIQPPTAVGGTVVDPTTRSARSLVRIREGETLVLGGLIDRNEEEIVRRVPILSSIPLLGEAFTNRERSNTATEIIVFVTPRVMSDPGGVTLASTGAPAVQVGPPPVSMREQEALPPRQRLIEEALNRFERPSR